MILTRDLDVHHIPIETALALECKGVLNRMVRHEEGVRASFQGFVLGNGRVLCGAYIEQGAEHGLPRTLLAMVKRYLEGADMSPENEPQRKLALSELDALIDRLKLIDRAVAPQFFS